MRTITKDSQGYVVLTAMILIGALATITTIATLYQGTQILTIAGKAKLKQQAYFLAESCAEIALKEIRDDVVLTRNPNADYYNLDANNKLYFLTGGPYSFTSPPVGTGNSYCRLMHKIGRIDDEAIYAVGTVGANGTFREDSEMILLLNPNNNLIYR